MTVKILHIIKSLGRGGAEMLLPESLKLHDKNRFDFHYIYFLPWKNQMAGAIREQGGKVTCFGATNNLHLMLKVFSVARYVREHKIELIHAHLPWAGILARIVGKMCGIPVLYTEHNKQERYHIGTRILNLLTMNMGTEVIAVSADVADSIFRNKHKLKIPVRIIQNGVNTTTFTREHFDGMAVRSALKIPHGAPLIGTIAVFRFQKRLDLWMELAATILSQNGDAHFIIVGDGPLKEDLLKKRKALGLENRLHMPGLETEIRPFLAAFDVYMMCSVFEGLPIAMLEAMSMRCAVATTDAGGIKEVIRHNVDGLLCPVDQPDQLVGFISTLLNDQDVRKRFGDQARQRVMGEFSMERMVRDLERVYDACRRDE